MSVRKKFHLIIVTWFTAGCILILLSLNVSEIFMVVLLGLAVFLGIYAGRLKCLNCGKKALYNNVRVLGLEMELWTVWIPKRCQRCGEKH